MQSKQTVSVITVWIHLCSAFKFYKEPTPLFLLCVWLVHVFGFLSPCIYQQWMELCVCTSQMLAESARLGQICFRLICTLHPIQYFVLFFCVIQSMNMVSGERLGNWKIGQWRDMKWKRKGRGNIWRLILVICRDSIRQRLLQWLLASV